LENNELNKYENKTIFVKDEYNYKNNDLNSDNQFDIKKLEN
jgi:hypothetical protein